MFGESDEAGVGVIVRNSKGEVKAALAEKIRKPPSVLRAAIFSQELSLDRVIFEGDSEQVMRALQWGGRHFASGGQLI